METYCWPALPVAGYWVTVQDFRRLYGDLNNGRLAAQFQWRKCALEVSCTWDALAQFQWRKCALEVSCTWDALYKSTSLSFTFDLMSELFLATVKFWNSSIHEANGYRSSCGCWCMFVRYESASLCRVHSQLSAGTAATSRAWSRRRSQHVQTGRVALEAVTGLRRSVASLCHQRGLPAGISQRCTESIGLLCLHHTYSSIAGSITFLFLLDARRESASWTLLDLGTYFEGEGARVQYSTFCVEFRVFRLMINMQPVNIAILLALFQLHMFCWILQSFRCNCNLDRVPFKACSCWQKIDEQKNEEK